MLRYDKEEIAQILENMPSAEIPMIVVTNEDRVNEAIVVSDDGNREYKALLAMVTEINSTQVDCK